MMADCRFNIVSTGIGMKAGIDSAHWSLPQLIPVQEPYKALFILKNDTSYGLVAIWNFISFFPLILYNLLLLN